jgi:aspartyl-tRNA(Asn)/glutamyl-tRNA(Gln) amidotransferase subunit B
VEEIRASLPELPSARRERFVRDYQLSPYDADVLTQRKDVADYFEAGIAAGAPPKEMANWVMTELLHIVREEKLDRALVIRDWPLAPAQLARLVSLVQAGTVNRNTAKALIPRLRGTTTDPRDLVAAEGLGQVSDRAALEAAVAEVLARHPGQVAELKAGKERVLGFLVGQVMKATKGKGNPQLVQEVLRAVLGR